MSVKLLYGVDGRQSCTEAEKLGGFCYCRLNPTGKSYGDKIYKDDKKILVDLAKYPPVAELSREKPIELALNFGIVPVESKNVRDVTLYNSKDTKTPMTSLPFLVEPREELMEQYDKAFYVLLPERMDFIPGLIVTGNSSSNQNQVKQNRGYADAQFKFRVLFKPKLPAIAYTSSLFIWIGNVPIKLKCHGFSEGPFVAFSQNVINFGGQYYGSETSIHVDMMNHSICDAEFQFDTDNFKSVFKICPMTGTIHAGSTIKVDIVFKPHKPQTFYKRIYCLLHQQNPQYLDLIGVCIPRPFFVANPIDFCVSSQDTLFLPLPTPTFEEYFQHDFWGIKLSREDFSFLSRNDQVRPSGLEFSLTSSLPYDVLIEWVPDPSGVFVISPPISFLNGHQSTSFTVNFYPQFPDTFYAGQLECYIYPTTYIWPHREGPPWIFTKRQREKVEEQSRASTAVNTTATTTVPAIESSDMMSRGITGNNNKGDEEVEKFVTIQQEEYELNRRHSSLETTTDTFKGPPSTFGSEKTGIEEMEEMDKNLAYNMRKGGNSPFTPPPTKTKTADQNQNVNKGPRRINFQLYIQNGKGTVLHSIVANKHYHSVDLYDLLTEEFQCKVVPDKVTKLVGNEMEIEEELPEEEEEEQVMEEIQEQLPPPKKSKSKTKKKDKGKKKKKGKDDTTTDGEDSSKTKSDTEVDDNSKKDGKKSKRDKKDKKEKMEKKKKKKDKNSSQSEGEDGVKEKFNAKGIFQDDEFGSEIESLAEEEIEDIGGGGDNMLAECPPEHLEKREGVFSVPEQRRESDCSGPMELALPLCLTIRVAGHTYASSSQPPIPHFNLPSRVLMSPTLPQHREFRTIIMKNTSDLPIFFDIKEFEKSEIYSAKPLIGIIPGEEKQILMISMNTVEPHTAAYTHTASANLNIIDENPLSIFGYAEVPKMYLTILSDPSNNVNQIACPTTIPGYATSCHISMKNPSRFHYRFCLEFLDEEDAKLKSVFTPTPFEGIIAPYDSVKITWKFVPYAYTSYTVPWKFRFEVMGAKSEDSFWNAVYEIILPLFGVGDECYLKVDPEVLDFDLIQIFDTVSKTFTITNEGNSIVQANLVVLHEQWLQWYNKDQIQISPSQIYLTAGEKVEIKVTVRPDRPIMYKFTVNYELESSEKDPDGNLIFEFKPLHLIDVLFMGDHAIAKITHVQQIAKHPAWNVNEVWEMFSITELNHLMTPLRHSAREGSLPNVKTVSFRFPDAPVGSPPALFALVLTNLSNISEYWRIHTQPPRNNKLYQLRQETQKESFIGTGDAQDSESLLTALWTSKYKEMEQYNSSTPRMRQDQQNQSLTMAALKNSEKFLITPNSGTIENMKKQIINFKFTYNSVGTFRMPVLLRVYPAIFVWLELTGQTLRADQSSLQLMHKEEMIFHPIGLSDLDPPIQTFWVYNGGIVSTEFKVDMEPFKKIKGRNFGHACIECLTPEGVALPKSWTPIKLRFAPLEFKTYTAPLKVLANEEWKIVELKGKTAMAEQVFLHPDPEPHHSDIFDPFVPIAITPIRIVFPHFIPTGCRSTSLIFITNLSAKHSMSFAWPEVTFVNSTSIKFLPDIGILAPKEQCACQVIIEAGNVNQILSTTIRCWIEDVTAVNRFRRKESLWRGELVEFKEVTVVTKKGLQKMSKQVIQDEPNKPQSFSRLLGISCYIGSVFGTLDNLEVNEQTKVIVDGVQPLPAEGRNGKGGDGKMLILSPLNRHLAKDILSQLIWDLTLLSPSWPNHIRNITKRQSVFFDDYKQSEASTEVRDDMKPKFRVPLKLQENILEFILFTMLQESADLYSSSENWYDLKPSDTKG